MGNNLNNDEHTCTLLFLCSELFRFFPQILENGLHATVKFLSSWDSYFGDFLKINPLATWGWKNMNIFRTLDVYYQWNCFPRVFYLFIWSSSHFPYVNVKSNWDNSFAPLKSLTRFTVYLKKCKHFRNLWSFTFSSCISPFLSVN